MSALRILSGLTALALLLGTGAAQADDKARVSQQELNIEYAKLYKSVSNLRLLDELLLIKFESDETEGLVKQIAAFGARAKAELEDLRKADPRISFEDTGRTELAHRASDLQKKERLRAYAPITGASGADFERMLLLGQVAVLYPLRFRVQVMADAESSAARAKYLRNMQKELDQLYVRTSKLLDKRYFSQGANTPLGSAGDVD